MRGRLSTVIALVVVVGILLILLVSANRGSANSPETTTRFQEQILEDGTITVAEYNLAAASTMACVESAGATVSAPTVREDGRLSFEYGGTRDRGAMESLVASYEACYEGYLIDVDRTWSSVSGPGIGNNLPVFREVVQCYFDRGHLPREDDLDDERVLELYRLGAELGWRARSCVTEIQEGYALE
jgi:hypothetical protein